MIHPTAIIDPRAELGAECEIGPYCVIGPHVVLGDRCRLHSHVVIEGHTVLGRENEIYPFASVGLKTEDLKWRGGVTWTRIGDRNTIRECVTINSATGDGEATVIGSGNHITSASHIGHNTVVGDGVVLASAGLAGHVIIEDGAVVGGKSVVHQFCRVGRGAMVAGLSRVVQDVPPYMIAEGHPAVTRTINKVGLARRGVSDAVQRALRRAYKLLFREGLSRDEALGRIATELPSCPELEHLVAFVRASKRGLCR
jgi:UDP-N-acetylglucosamine acyltransferase